jgi:hypothetical protein
MDRKAAAYKRAKKKVNDLRGFYIHLLVYLLINGFFSINVLVREWFGGSSWRESIEDFSFFSLWFFWGIGLLFHAIVVFDLNTFFYKKIKRILEAEQREKESFSNRNNQ